MNYFAFDCKKQGFSHIKHNKECQDSSLSYFDDKIAMAIVCDGHGGDDYVRSAVGSKFGCEIAKKNICDFVANVDKEKLKHNSDQFMLQLKNRIVSYWRNAVNDHYKQHPFEESELAVLSEKARKRYLEEGRIESAYGTTLIAAVITPYYWFGIHIGDGKCVAIDQKGNFSQPVPWDEKCFLNSTTSICDTEALNNFRHFYSEERPVAVFVGSDGIDDCFQGDEQMYHFYTVILSSFVVSDAETAKAELLDYLPRLSEKGSGDDVSVAAVFDRDRVNDLKPVREFVATHKPEPEAGREVQNNAEQSKPDNGSDNSEKNDAVKSTKELEEIIKKKIAEEIQAALKENKAEQAEKAIQSEKEAREQAEKAMQSEKEAREQAEKERQELEKAMQSEKEAKEQAEKERQELEKARQSEKEAREQAEKERKELEEKLAEEKKANEAKEAENAKLKADIEAKKQKKKKLTRILIAAGSLFVVFVALGIYFFNEQNKNIIKQAQDAKEYAVAAKNSANDAAEKASGVKTVIEEAKNAATAAKTDAVAAKNAATAANTDAEKANIKTIADNVKNKANEVKNKANEVKNKVDEAKKALKDKTAIDEANKALEDANKAVAEAKKKAGGEANTAVEDTEKAAAGAEKKAVAEAKVEGKAKKAMDAANKATGVKKAIEDADNAIAGANKAVEDAKKAFAEAKQALETYAADIKTAIEEAKKAIEDAQKAIGEAKAAEDAQKAIEEAKTAIDAALKAINAETPEGN